MDPLTVAYRRRLGGVRARCIAELRILWGEWDATDRETWPRFEVPALLRIEAHSAEAARIGAEYYRAMRAKYTGQAAAPARPRAMARREIDDSLLAVGLAGTYVGVRLGRTHKQAQAFAFRRVALAASRHVSNGWRDSVLRCSQADEDSVGWERMTTGTCQFCEDKAAEGVTSSGDFPSHDGCQCVAEPVFDLKLSAQMERFADELLSAAPGILLRTKDLRTMSALRERGLVEMEMIDRVKFIRGWRLTETGRKVLRAHKARK